jgi:hypothetical protein
VHGFNMRKCASDIQNRLLSTLQFLYQRSHTVTSGANPALQPGMCEKMKESERETQNVKGHGRRSRMVGWRSRGTSGKMGQVFVRNVARNMKCNGNVSGDRTIRIVSVGAAPFVSC